MQDTDFLSPEKRLTKLIEQTKPDPEILAVILFGSHAREEEHKGSDIDVCLILVPATYSQEQLSEKKLHYLKSHPLDIHVFQQLPLYIRTRVLKEGKILFCRDEDILYEVAFTHIREYADFEHIYREYLEEVAHG